ncbi:MAG: protein kinase [Crenarchaeota archaeon]|nr:protein kinase [Thermoproteota archaeon]
MRLSKLIGAIIFLLIIVGILGAAPPPFKPLADVMASFLSAIILFLFIAFIVSLVVSLIRRFSKPSPPPRPRPRYAQNVRPRTYIPERRENRVTLPQDYPTSNRTVLVSGRRTNMYDIVIKVLNKRISYYVPASIRYGVFSYVKLSHNIPGFSINLSGSVCYLIGEGAWSKVYLCVTQSGERYALKIPRTLSLESLESSYSQTASIDDTVVDKIRREIEILKGLSHPCIIKLVDYSLQVPAILYEFADGLSLSYQRSQRWAPSLEDLLTVLIQVADALRYIHKRGIIHGDIKLGNILIVNGTAKIGDFNTVSKLLSSSYHFAIACTRGYCAPEQLMSDLRAKSCQLGMEDRLDVYQLANVLLALTIGDTIDGEERLKMTESDLRRRLINLRPIELRELAVRMLEVDPTMRPSMEEVLKELVEIYCNYVGVS